MPMKKTIDIDQHLYDAYIHVDGYRVYKLTDKDVFVEIYLDLPSVSLAEFWRDYAYSGEADKWFPQLDPDTIQFQASPGQYGIGTDIRAYGRLTNASEVVVEKIREALKRQKSINSKVKALEKQIDALKKESSELKQSSWRINIPL